ncbi:hypothetical protein CIHG_00418 [Coccidioides immitis H538.4]|uniref:Secreted protein n=3 Tax=Coccidioides immitis TaxID=5501 RepID=A0A0J8QHR6_COCIT|nr:hypothetical protein CIRG_07235 [Coccidioides immitis RMSCC 2394]KMU71995.1 hypothetical protein CISG_00304 [Coccidioides immitis RMSCC 3703]KMU82637.1 hypothetical protein CIHG_00418 [Coccidioides immitis H538.4]
MAHREKLMSWARVILVMFLAGIRPTYGARCVDFKAAQVSNAARASWSLSRRRDNLFLGNRQRVKAQIRGQSAKHRGAESKLEVHRAGGDLVAISWKSGLCFADLSWPRGVFRTKIRMQILRVCTKFLKLRVADEF